MRSQAIGENVRYSPSPNRKSNIAYESCCYIGITLTTLPKASLTIIVHVMNNAVRLWHVSVLTPTKSLLWRYAGLGFHHEIVAVIVTEYVCLDIDR